MKAKKSSSKETYVLLALVLLVTYLFFRPVINSSTKASSSKVAPLKQVQQLVKPSELVDQKVRREGIVSQRKEFFARLLSNTKVFKPQVTNQGIGLTFRLQPIERSCKDGDIDLIKETEGPRGKLLLTLEDDQDNLLTYKNLVVSNLKSPYLFPVKFKPSDGMKIFRINLCSENSRKSCQGLSVTDPKVATRSAGHIYYSYSFGVRNKEIHLFDGTNLPSKQNSKKYLQAHNGNSRQTSFLEQTMKDQEKLGILPLTIEDQMIVFPLYVNNKEKCSISQNRR